MSWIKKIFGKLSDNDEQFEEYYDENDDDVQRIEPTKPERKHIAGPSHSRDVEARMTYQYPKGNFRFPLISDGETRERPRRARRNQEKEEKQNEQEPKPKSQNHSVAKRKWKEESPTTSVKPKKSPKVEKGNSRPFTPTEIPSPIYGFKNRPIKKEENVEYELKKFLHNEEERKEAAIDHKAQRIVENSLLSGEETSSPVGKKEEPTSNGLRGGTSDIPPVKFEKIPKSVVKETDHHDEEITNSEVTSPITSERISLITEAPDEEPNISIVHDQSTPVGSDAILETTNPVKEEPVSEESPSFEEEIPAEESVVEENSTEEETEAVVPPEPIKEEVEEVVPPEPIKEEVEATTPLEPIKEEAGATAPKEPIKEEPQRRKRSHLPFNVLMLKQDKRQMDTRKTPESPSMEKRKTIKTEQKPSVQEHTEKPSEAPRPQEEQPTQQSQVQGEEAVKSYSELSSSTKRARDYVFPEMDYLMPPVSKEMSEEWLDSQRLLLDETLHNFNVRAKVVNVTQGPSVTRFEVQPEPGVKVNKITNLTDDIKLSLAAKDIRMEAPIPGKHTIGIEVPNRESRPVCISEVIASPQFQEPSSPLTAALGLDISGQPIVTDLSKMPHGLIAGATGSGKSVCINSILVSLLYKASPDELKLLLIDPKMVELAPYNRIPHLVSPVITDVKAATAALKWAVEEMERRYELFAHTGVRDIKRFNELAKRNRQYSDMLPYLVIVIDELADLMMMSPADVEEAICRIAQKARACGIHLIIATQRPSVDVITGLIKANVPTRVAFSVSSSVDSRTIIDGSGAERLLGKGDMLFLENGSSKPVRLQGTFVSDDEIDEIIRHVREQREPDYIFQQDELIKQAQVTEEEDELFLEACEFVVDQGGASASSLQRRFRIGYNRAARLMEMMESNGIISESRGSKPRDVLISESELETLA
ncbi:DNA translocase FtsK [Rossellomorea aquimaris]|uniref:DNA translocase FtsK n=1 Tax=Rossellomorea aquimaris TaxID=189382 RepID=UPI001CD19870|nr:DNA translocase FtsK [Rossellomorea aquimaris]MCA1057404.1 DNA translocase FtsK [Rossellomorea aquimaris]